MVAIPSLGSHSGSRPGATPSQYKLYFGEGAFTKWHQWAVKLEYVSASLMHCSLTLDSFSRFIFVEIESPNPLSSIMISRSLQSKHAMTAWTLIRIIAHTPLDSVEARPRRGSPLRQSGQASPQNLTFACTLIGREEENKRSEWVYPWVHELEER